MSKETWTTQTERNLNVESIQRRIKAEACKKLPLIEICQTGQHIGRGKIIQRCWRKRLKLRMITLKKRMKILKEGISILPLRIVIKIQSKFPQQLLRIYEKAQSRHQRQAGEKKSAGKLPILCLNKLIQTRNLGQPNKCLPVFQGLRSGLG